MTTRTVDLFAADAGRWIKVPATEVDGNLIVVTGRALRVAEVHKEEFLDGEIENPCACVEHLRRHEQHGLRADVFTFAQKLPNVLPRYEYSTVSESVAAIRLSSFDDWWGQLPQDTRKNVRRAAKRGVVVKTRVLDDDLVRGIAEINNETPVRQGRRFAHYGESLDEVKKDFSAFSDRCEMFCAYAGEELVGILKVMYRGQVASVLKLQSKLSHYDKRPSNALIAAAVEQCDKKGMSFFTYGQYRYGNQDKTSLMDFKARNGFVEILVPRFYVPLTARGRLGIALGLHRGLSGMVPASALSLGRKVRATWHGLRASAGVAQ
jgi:hypothetical protein